jgi:hypothetical protein
LKKGNLIHKKKHNLSNSTSSNINQITATDDLIEGSTFKHSKQGAQPFRSELRTMSMSSNLQGETIPMAYSSSFLDFRNNNEHQQKDSDADNSSSNYLDLEINLKFEVREIIQRTITKPIQMINENEAPIARRKKKKSTRLITEEEPMNTSQIECLNFLVDVHCYS